MRPFFFTKACMWCMLLQFISLCAYRPIWYPLHQPLAINPSWIKDALQSSLSSLFLYFLPPRNSRGICARMMHLWLCIMFVCNLLYLQFKLMHILMCILQHPSWEINPRSTRKQSSLMCRWYSALQWGYIHADAQCSDMKRCTVQCCTEWRVHFPACPAWLRLICLRWTNSAFEVSLLGLSGVLSGHALPTPLWWYIYFLHLPRYGITQFHNTYRCASLIFCTNLCINCLCVWVYLYFAVFCI